jgi:itaconate CoA-transferase
MSSHFVWLNRGKESVVLDVKDAAGRSALHRLVERADVLVQNLAPGAAERLGLVPDELRRAHPRLIVCGISGYGTGGPYQDLKAYDLLVQCEAGLLSITGTPDEPVKVGISIADIAAGMYAYTGILTALYERERTGQGTTLSVAMLDALGEWMGYAYYYGTYGGTPPARTGARHASIAPYGPFTTGDGRQIFFGLQSEREWATLCTKVLNRPELIEDERFARNSLRVKNNDELTPIIEERLAHLTADEAVSLLEEAGMANARLRTMSTLRSVRYAPCCLP